MAPPSRKLRSVNEIRTLARRDTRSIAPHTAYMKITSLELEKLRLNRVRDNATRRIGDIDCRMQEIEEEKMKLMQALAKARAHGPGPGGESTRGPGTKGLIPRGAGSIALRY
jgi:hypothetical protein